MTTIQVMLRPYKAGSIRSYKELVELGMATKAKKIFRRKDKTKGKKMRRYTTELMATYSIMMAKYEIVI